MTRLNILRLFNEPVAFAEPVPNVEPVAAAEPLCPNCVWSHVARGFYPGEIVLFCNLGYALRSLEFPVRECTDYRGRSAVAGFANGRPDEG